MTTLFDDFSLERASRTGAAHLRLERNNQDALALRERDGVLVLVTTDGCSEGSRSEVGAWLGAAWLAEMALVSADPEQLHQGLLARLAALGLDEQGVAEGLLFSWLLARIDAQRVQLVGCGDGCWSLDGRLERRDPGPDNAPPYSAYGLFPQLDEPQPELLAELRTEELQLLILASDGLEQLPAEGLVEACTAPAGNPRRLERLLRRHGRDLHDDTSLFLLRRRPCA